MGKKEIKAKINKDTFVRLFKIKTDYGFKTMGEAIDFLVKKMKGEIKKQ